MTDVTEASPETTAGAGEESEGRRRGRPRPDATLKRDEHVYEVLTSPMTKNTVAEVAGISRSEAYLSLWRLRYNKRVRSIRNGSTHTWERVPEGEQPAVTPTEPAPA